jgi:prepilin peptidase CpaA
MLTPSDTGENAALIQWGTVLVASLVAALWDLNTRRIPNWLTLSLFVLGLVQAGIFGGWSGLGGSFLAGVILAAPYVILFLFAGGGAGDAKLMAGAGVWLGMSQMLPVLLFVSIFGIVIALLKAAFSKQFFTVLKRIHAIMLSFFVFFSTRGKINTVVKTVEMADDEKLTVPYGPAIFAGLLSAAVYSWLM